MNDQVNAIRYLHSKLVKHPKLKSVIPRKFQEFAEKYYADEKFRGSVYRASAYPEVKIDKRFFELNPSEAKFSKAIREALPDFKKRRLISEKGQESIASMYKGDFDKLLKDKGQLVRELSSSTTPERIRHLKKGLGLIHAYEAYSTLSASEDSDEKYKSVSEGYASADFEKTLERDRAIGDLQESLEESRNNYNYTQIDPLAKEQLGKTIAQKEAKLQELQSTPLPMSVNPYLLYPVPHTPPCLLPHPTSDYPYTLSP